MAGTFRQSIPTIDPPLGLFTGVSSCHRLCGDHTQHIWEAAMDYADPPTPLIQMWIKVLTTSVLQHPLVVVLATRSPPELIFLAMKRPRKIVQAWNTSEWCRYTKRKGGA